MLDALAEDFTRASSGRATLATLNQRGPPVAAHPRERTHRSMSHGFGRPRPRSLLASAVLGLLLVLAPLLAAPIAADRDRDRRGDVTTQVVGGTPVADGDYPFVAALLDVRNGRSAYRRQYCGGSLIDARHVLTAAHCVDWMKRDNLRVIVGRTALNSKEGQTRQVSRVAVHPAYDEAPNDAAVLTLSAPVTGIVPIRLAANTPADNDFENSGILLTTAGWGNRIFQPANGSNRSDYPQRMYEVDVPVVSDHDCNDTYSGEVDPSLELCAGEEGKDSCQGDSGGPLFIEESGGGFVLLGIVSWGYGCGDSYPGVYTEVNSPSIAGFIADATGS
jgi:secreted trypsin-like serine protease